MAPKKINKKQKPGIPSAGAATAKPVDGTAGKQPVKKKKKNDPLRPQPAWLFPPDEENPILNPKNKSKEEIQKEIDQRLAAIRFLEHKSVTAPVKIAPPVELLQLVGAFLASYGFVSTGRIFSLERNARKKLEGWEDSIGEKKFAKAMPDLVKIYKDWKADYEGDSDVETSSSGSDSEADVVMKDANSSSSSDDDDSSSDADSESEGEKKTAKAAPKTNGVKIRTKLTEDSPKQAKIAPVESSSSSSESDSESEAEQKAPATKVAASKTASDSDSSSSSESDSDSDSASDDEKAKKTAKDKKKASLSAPPVIPKAGSDSSSTLKGNSPSKDASSSGSSSSSASETSSSESDSDSDSDAAPATKSVDEAKLSSKRKASSPDVADTTPISTKKTKLVNEPFSRIPKDTKIDPRLASNKYISYDYADKAHQDLVVTKGKGFTKEKNKKKRGSYRGGRIDLEGGKAVKFDD